MPAIAFNRLVGPVPLDVVIQERHTSTIDITENPIETGAKVNDHAYIMPKRLTLEVCDGDATGTWQALKRLQESRVPFTIVTGLDVYSNMLIRQLDATRTKDISYILSGTIELQEVILVDTSYAAGEAGNDKATSSGKPGGEKSSKAAKPSPSRSNNPVTGDKASGTLQRGDAPTKTVPPTPQNSSIFHSLIEGS